MTEENKLPNDGGLEALSEQALRDRHAANTARIQELAANPDRTLADAREMARLTDETNQIATHVAEFAPAAEVAGLPEIKPLATVVLDAATAAEIEAAAANGPNTETLTAVTDETAMAEAIAASAALTESLTTPTTPVTGGAVVRTRPFSAVTASASSGSIQAGATLTLSDIGTMVMEAAGDARASGRQQRIATITAGATPVLSHDNSTAANTRALAEYLRGSTDDAGNAIVAAAGEDPFTVCGPADILRTVPECLNESRYVDQWFPNIPSSHGEVQFYRPLGLADVAGSTVVWDQVTQTAIDPLDPTTWKPCIDIPCLPTSTVGIEAVVQCMCMPVFQQMTSPEAVGSALAAMRAALARECDGHLLDIFDTLSSAYSYNAATSVLGANIDIYDLLGRLLGIAAASNRHLDLSGYTLGVEAGLMQHLMLDNAMANTPRLAQEAAESMFGGLGIGNVQVTPDWALSAGGGPWAASLPINLPGTAAIAVPPRPTTWTLRLFRRADFGLLAPGEEVFGIIPDLDNKRRNRVCWFGETWEGLGKMGCSPAFTIEVTNLCATGTRSLDRLVPCP